MRKEWIIAENHRTRMYECVRLYKEHGCYSIYRCCYSIYRCIDDWDDDGDDSPYNVEEYLNLIPDTNLQQAICATTDQEVVRWVKKHLIKDQSNYLDALEEFILSTPRVFSLISTPSVPLSFWLKHFAMLRWLLFRLRIKREPRAILCSRHSKRAFTSFSSRPYHLHQISFGGSCEIHRNRRTG